MEITDYKKNDILILSVNGKINAETAVTFENTLFNNIESGEKKIIIDCRNLNYISSRGLRSFYGALESIKKHNGIIVITEPPANVRNIFDIVDFQADFPIYKDVDAALRGLI